MEQMKKIIVALDSFKQCMTSQEANEAVAEGLAAVVGSEQIQRMSVSDGGEGFLQAMQPDEVVHCHVHDALMRWTDACFGIKDDEAIIEVAEAIGLSKIEHEQLNPLQATSYGVGELMVRALDKGCRSFVIGLGGSATSDCGLGMLKCLRQAFQTKHNKMWYDAFDTSTMRQLLVMLATDVDNPLYGPLGAAHVFAPQKGASEEDIEKLDRRAMTFARMAAKHQGIDMSNQPGAGAAGGLGYAFMEFMTTQVKSGAALVLDSIGFNEALQQASLVITGEGSADRQTLMGKIPYIIMQRARALGVPTILMAGKAKDIPQLLDSGFAKVMNINEGQSLGNALEKTVAKQRLGDCSRRLLNEKTVR